MHDAIVIGARCAGAATAMLLARWGLLDRVLATNCPAVTSTITDMGDFPLAGDGLEVDGIPLGLGPRRSRLDHVLVEAAVEAGAELREGFAVHDFATAGGSILGVLARSAADGTSLHERARIVIGAEGATRPSRGASRRL